VAEIEPPRENAPQLAGELGGGDALGDPAEVLD
jgi:hypothetical protein